MNNLLNLKGSFNQESSKGRPGTPVLSKNTSVNKSTILNLISEVEELLNYWNENKVIKGCLVEVHYNRIIAKSKRIQELLSEKKNPANEMIVGAKFSENSTKHIITYFVSVTVLENAIKILSIAIEILNKYFNGNITDDEFNKKKDNKIDSIDFKKYGISKSKFQKIIVDISSIERFGINLNEIDSKCDTIVTLYDTGEKVINLLKKFDIDILENRVLDKTTVLLDSDKIKKLNKKAPYLISMSVTNISTISPNEFMNPKENKIVKIPSPNNEPTIGVIDTLFDEKVYFSEWVSFTNTLDSNIPISSNDYKHGTGVTSLIVDGARLNPQLDDGCGRFKVRHFGVATATNFNSFTIIRTIKEIVASNPDIKVWNLSLGSNSEIRNNFISAEGAILDKIQFENDIIFVIAGTNDVSGSMNKKIGAPADSINSVIVNSVNSKNEPAPYSRKGIVLSFFTKPDVCYYGGKTGEYITVFEGLGEAQVSGTSYAAPWISRKLSYLIDIIGLKRETAKALLIDSAIGWDEKKEVSEISFLGNGVVPIKIKDILSTPDEEIKFFVEGVSEKYNTYNYNFPVPMYKEKYPFVAKATLCYFPNCSRNQGVDYTNTELDIYFGRIQDNGAIKSINENKQSVDEKDSYLKEENARKMFRKWDNVKHINETLKKNPRGKKVYENNMWGMSIKTKERLHKRDGEGIKFGVVVTLKEIKGANRIEDFIQQCILKGWIVNEIDVNNRVDVFQKAEEELILE